MVTFVAFVVNDNDRTTTLEIRKDRLSVEHYNAINSNRINNKTDLRSQTSDVFTASANHGTHSLYPQTHVSRTVNR